MRRPWCSGVERRRRRSPMAADPVFVRFASAVAPDSPILAVEPETFVFPCADDWQGYLRGFAAAADRIARDLAEGAAARAPSPLLEEAAVASATWGLVATRTTTSHFSGRGIKVAVLDTGFEFRHPDFLGRTFTQQSFIE